MQCFRKKCSLSNFTPKINIKIIGLIWVVNSKIKQKISDLAIISEKQKN
jgi:hypothetical protein